MPTPITFTLTNAGLNAALDADANGLTLSLTQIGIGSGQYTPDATETALDTEIARYPLSGGDIEPNSKTLRFSATLESVTTQQAFEVGLFTSTGVLFAVASTTGIDPLILVTANIAFVGSFGLVLSDIPAGSVTVVTDPNAALAVVLMAQHVAAENPHPQYAMKAAFDSHVAQNALEHSNLLTMIQAVNQRVANLEIREEVQIGEFIITDDPRNPVLYKGYGEWRLVPDVMLSGLDVGGIAGQVRQLAVGTGQNVRTTFFWRRIDPNAITPTRTVTIAADAFEINLRDLFVAQYGEPVIGERVRFVVEEGVLVTAHNTSNSAIVTGDWPPASNLTMDIYGLAVGRGGNGGGFYNGGGVGDEQLNGTDGGTALNVSSSAQITVNIMPGGTLAGGGGGGPAAFYDPAGTSDDVLTSGGGGAPYGAKGFLAYGAMDTDAQDGFRLVGGSGATTSTLVVMRGGRGGNIGENGEALPTSVSTTVTEGIAGQRGFAVFDPSGSATIINNGSLLSR